MMPSDREAAKPELSQYGASPFATRGEHIGEYARYIVAPRPFVHALPVTTQADHGAGTGGLVAALTELRDTLADTSYALRLPSAEQAAAAGAAIVRQLDDYLLPRLSQLDAPLLVVVGGSTGAGKSTLVNSMVRAPVSLAEVPMFVLPETQLDGQGLLPERVIAGLRDWLTGLARSAAARAEVIRQTVEGAITALETSVRRLALAADDQVTAVEALT